MGNTTIIELNHDQAEEIFRDENSQKIFLEQIREQLSCFGRNGKFIQGGRVVAGFHRSGNIYNAWSKFKDKWGSK